MPGPKLTLLVVLAVTSAGSILAAKNNSIILDTEGRSISPIPTVVGNSKITFEVRGAAKQGESFSLYYDFAPLNAMVDAAGTLPKADKPIKPTIEPGTGVSITVEGDGALYYYLVKNHLSVDSAQAVLEEASKNVDSAQAALDEAKESLKQAQATADAEDLKVQQLSDAVKAYAGMSTPIAAQGVRDTIPLLQIAQKKLAKDKDEVKKKTDARDKAQQALDDAKAADTKKVVLRAGIIPISKGPRMKDYHRRPVYYRFMESENLETPFRLERMGEFPVFTVQDDLYLIIVNHRRDLKPSDFVLSYGTTKGAVIDIAPVRPTQEQQSGFKLTSTGTTPQSEEADFSHAYTDRLLAFANKLPGETIPSVTVSSYAKVVTADKEDGKTKTLTKETKTVKILDSELWPQIHSLFHFNLSTGVVATWLRDPAYSRVLTDPGIPAKTSPASDLVPAKYRTATDSGSARAMPVLAFSGYLWPRDIQVPWQRKDLAPAPTVGFSLKSPADDFFFGASSEFRRNVQVVYGYHFGRITQLGPAGVDDPTSGTAPPTIKRFHGNFFVGLTFNLNFIKDLYK
jgi:hypothetical protein